MLYQNGRNAAEQFFSTWNFDEYIAAYRSNLPREGRRERLHEHMKRVYQMLETQGLTVKQPSESPTTLQAPSPLSSTN